MSEERVKKAERRLDHLEERIGKLERWIEQVDTAVGKLRDRLDRIESQIRGEPASKDAEGLDMV